MIKQVVKENNGIAHYNNTKNGPIRGLDKAVKLYTSVANLKTIKIYNKSLGRKIYKLYEHVNTTNKCTQISIQYNSLDDLKWIYEPILNSYHRYSTIKKHVNDMNIFAKTIIIQYVSANTGSKCDHNERIAPDGRTYQKIYHPDKPYCHHTEYNIVGQGNIIILSKGATDKGKWTKKDLNSPTIWYDSLNNPVSFLEDRLWIQVVNQKNKIKFN